MHSHAPARSANPTATDFDGRTPAEEAFDEEHLGLIEVLGSDDWSTAGVRGYVASGGRGSEAWSAGESSTADGTMTATEGGPSDAVFVFVCV